MNNNESILNQIPSELLKTLAEIGYSGISLGMHKETCKIFDSIVAVRPDSVEAKVAIGASKIMMFKLTEGSKIMLEVLKHDKNNGIAKAMLALSLSLAKVYDQAIAIANEVVDTSSDSAAKQLASEIIASCTSKTRPIDIAKLREEQTNKILASS